MKSFIVSALLLSSITAFAWPERSDLDDLRDDICTDKKIDYKSDTATCKASNAKAVLSAKVGDSIKVTGHDTLGFWTHNPIDLGVVVDADTNIIFEYHRWLLDASGKKVGVLAISGWENYEMEARGRVDARYNLKGDLIWVAIKQH